MTTKSSIGGSLIAAAIATSVPLHAKDIANVAPQAVEKSLPPQSVQRYFQSIDIDYTALSAPSQKYASIIANFEKTRCLCVNEEFNVSPAVGRSCAAVTLSQNSQLDALAEENARRRNRGANVEDAKLTMALLSVSASLQQPSTLAGCEEFAARVGTKPTEWISNLAELKKNRAAEAVKELETKLIGTWEAMVNKFIRTWTFAADGTGVLKYTSYKTLASKEFPFRYSLNGNELDAYAEDLGLRLKGKIAIKDNPTLLLLEPRPPNEKTKTVYLDVYGRNWAFTQEAVSALSKSMEKQGVTLQPYSDPEDEAASAPAAPKRSDLKTAIVGTWYEPSGFSAASWTFKADGTGKVEMRGATAPVAFVLNGDVLSARTTGAFDAALSGEARVEGDVLFIAEHESVTVLARTRARADEESAKRAESSAD